MSTKNKKDTPLDSVDQIRNILFGEQIALIEDRFERLEKKLTSTIESLSNNVEKANNNLKQQIEKTNKQLTLDSSDLAEEQSKAVENLEKTINIKLAETESDLLNQIQAGLQNLDEKVSHRNDLAKLLSEMANKLAD